MSETINGMERRRENDGGGGQKKEADGEQEQMV
jgi:hypothetical protein